MSETQKSFWDMLKPGQTTSLPQFTKALFEPVTTGLANLARPSTNTSTTTNDTPTVHQYNPYGVDTFGGRVTNTLLNFGDKVDDFFSGANRGGPVPGAVQIDQAKLDTFLPLASGTNVTSGTNGGGGGGDDNVLYPTKDADYWANYTAYMQNLYDSTTQNKEALDEMGVTEVDAAKACEDAGGTYRDGVCYIRQENGSTKGFLMGSGSTGIARTGEQGPKLDDLKFMNGQVVRWDGTNWVPLKGETNTEIGQEIPGANANVPTDQYMQALGTNTLAGQTYSDALARQLAAVQERRMGVQESYSDLYQQARMSQSRRQGLSDTSGLTGGMADQYGSKLSAAEMGALGQIGMGREQAMRQTGLEELAAPSNAFLEARQMQEFEQGNQAFTEQMRQNAIAIISDPNTPQEIKNFYQNQLAQQYGVGPGAPGTVGPGGMATSTGVTDAATIPTVQRVEAFATAFTELGLDNAKIKQSPFKDSIVSNANDLGRLVTELGTANAANNPNYNYQYEINLVNRAISDRTSLTREEWEQLNEYTNSQTRASFTPDISFLQVSGQSTNPKIAIPATEATAAWIQSLIASGRLSATNFKERSPSFFENIAVGPGLKNYDKNYEIQLSGKTFTEYEKEYYDFLDTYNQKYKTGA
jgi:hypothetical protein